MPGRLYEIVVRGEPARGAVPGFEAVPASGRAGPSCTTVLRGWVPDQSALYGALDRVAEIGCELDGVHPVDPGA